MSTDSFSSKTISNSPSLNSASITVASINTQNLVGTSLTVSNLASSGFVNVGGDISCNGNIKSKSWNIITDISGSGNLYAKTLYLTGDISNNGNISTNGNLIVKGVNVGNSLSQWTTSGANVYYNGNVSVGKITNAYALDVSGSVNISGAINGTAVIGATQLSTGAITLGYVQYTTFASYSSATPVQITGLSLTVNIPTGGRYVRITLFIGGVWSNGELPFDIYIYNGVVGSGTQLQQSHYGTGAGNAGTGVSHSSYTVAILSNPIPGSMSFNAGVSSSSAQTVNISASSTQPIFLLAECI